MIQKKYLCRDMNSVREAIPGIKRILSTTPHKHALLTFYETGFSGNEIESMVGEIKDCVGPDLKISGISLTVIAELMPPGTGVLLNLILTEEAGIEVVTLPCEPGEEDDAARKLNEKLTELKNAKAVELFASNMKLNTTRFMEKSMEGHEEVVLFGTSTMRNLPTKLSIEEGTRVVEIEQVDAPDNDHYEMAYGDQMLPSVLFGDETRIKQVITNLLTNAVKYTEKGSVTLSIKVIGNAGDDEKESLKLSCPGEQCPDNAVRLRVSVKDTGIGIKPEDMDKLFEEFQRVEEKRNRKIEGTGLGLNITRELLELMGSRLNVESTYGEGSVFGFEIVQGVIKGRTDRRVYRKVQIDRSQPLPCPFYCRGCSYTGG